MGHATPARLPIALTAVLGLGLLVGSPASVAGQRGEEHLISVAVGSYDLVRRDDGATSMGLDYRFSSSTFLHLRPWAGLLSTSDEALWGGGGIYYDWAVTERLHLTPSFGAGFYDEGTGKDLGYTLEFRSQLDIAFRFRNDTRIGFNFGHLSNAGLSESNRGTEYLNLTYTVPLGRKRPGVPLADASAGPVEPPAD